MKKIMTTIVAFSSIFAFAESAVFDLSLMTLPKANVTLSGERDTFFRTLFVSNGKIVGDLLDSEKIPDENKLKLLEDLNYCEFRLAYSFFDQVPQGEFTLPEFNLTLNGTLENAQTLNGHHCRHDDAEQVRQSSLYNMQATNGHGFPLTTTVVSSSRLIVFPIGTFCYSHYPHSQLPYEGSLEALKIGFGDLIQLQ